MNERVKRVAGVLGMGLAWAIGWGLGVGGLVELIIDTRGEIVDMWPATLGMPAFVAGVAFGAVLWIAEGGRSFRELSEVRVLALGALTGLLLGLVLLAAPLASDFPVWRRVLEIVGRTVLLSAATAWLLHRLGYPRITLNRGPQRA